MSDSTHDGLVPSHGTQEADAAFERWHDDTFRGFADAETNSPRPDDAGVERVVTSEPTGTDTHRGAPSEDYDARVSADSDSGENDTDSDEPTDDEDYSEAYRKPWVERHKWKAVGALAGLLMFVLVFTLLGGFGGDDADTSKQGQIVGPQELSANEIMNRENETEYRRPTLKDSTTESARASSSALPSVTPRSITRSTTPEPSPLNEPEGASGNASSGGATGGGSGGEPQPATSGGQSAVVANVQPAQPEPVPVTTVYQTPDRQE